MECRYAPVVEAGNVRLFVQQRCGLGERRDSVHLMKTAFWLFSPSPHARNWEGAGLEACDSLARVMNAALEYKECTHCN